VFYDFYPTAFPIDAMKNVYFENAVSHQLVS
jgi:hypothetical protein